MKAKPLIFRAACLCIISFSASLPAQAANGTWTGNGTTNNWSDTTNWVNGSPAGGVDAVANIVGNWGRIPTPTLLSNESITLGALNLSGDRPGIMTDSTSWYTASLTLATSAGAPTVTVAGGVYANLVVRLQGTQGFVKNGLGALNLGRNNTYSGQTIVESGSLRIFDTNALGLGGSENGTSVSAGASIYLDVSVVGESLTIAGNGTGAGAITASDAYEYSPRWLGNVTLASDAKIAAGVSGNVSLNGNNLTLADSIEIAGTISGTGNLTIAAANNLGMTVLSGNNTYSGETIIQSGTLVVSHKNALGQGGSGNGTSVAAGASLRLDVNYSTVKGESLTIAGNGTGSGAITSDWSNYSWGGNVTLASDAKVGASISGNVSLNGNSLTLANFRDISGNISGTGNLIVDGSDFLYFRPATLTGNNSYTGATSVEGRGGLILANFSSLYGGDQALWTKEKITVENNSLLAVRVGGTNDFTTSQAASLLSELSTDINQNGLRAGASFGIDTTNATGNVTFSHAIGDSTGTGGGALSFRKLGAGKLILDQANTYSGDTFIDGGVLAISGNSTLGNGSGSLYMTADSSLDLGGTTQNFVNVDGWGGITNGTISGNGTYKLKGNVSANLTGSAGLEAWNVTLSGNNSFTGNTTVVDGYLYVDSINALYGGDLSMLNSSKIKVGYVDADGNDWGARLDIANVTGSQAAQIYDQLTPSHLGQGLNRQSSIGFYLTEGDHTWDRGLRDSYGDTGGRTHLSILEETIQNGTTLTLANTGTISGSIVTDTYLRFGAQYATGTAMVFGDTVDMNGYDAVTRGGYANWANDAENSSNLTLYVDTSDPEYNPNDIQYAATGYLGGSIGSSYSDSGKINLNKLGNGNAFFDGELGSDLRSINVYAGRLILSENVHHYSDNYDIGNNYIGGTATISNEASMLVHGELDSRVVVESGALLGGHGSITELVTVQSGGSLAPGASIGSLKIFSNVSFANNSTYEYEVNSSLASELGADLLVVNGNLNMTLTQLAFSDLSEAPQAFGIGTIFSLMNYTGTWNGGLFALGGNVLDEGEEFYAGQNYWRINYEATTGGLNFTSDYNTGNTSRFINLTATAVPEPSVAMLGAAASLLMLRRRRS
jgi:autotransporter-associated beta strand protein